MLVRANWAVRAALLCVWRAIGLSGHELHRPGGRRAAQDLQVWLVGNRHSNADKSIGWDDPFPNLSDLDVLVADLTTLTEPVLRRIDKAKLDQARKLLEDRLFSGGTIVIITQPVHSTGPGGALPGSASPTPAYTNYHIFPLSIRTMAVPDGTRIVTDDSHDFRAYARSIKSFSFHIETYYPEINPELPASSHNAGLAFIPGQGIRDNSRHDLGSTLSIAAVRNGQFSGWLPGAGRLVLLPPPTEPAHEAIGKILSVYGKTSPRPELPPGWAEQVPLEPVEKCRAEMARLESEKFKIQGEIDRLASKNDRILAHRRLLYSRGPDLEDAVIQAFGALGFDDVESKGGADMEDAALGMGSGTPYRRGVIEVKGTNRGTRMQDIDQCDRWARQRAAADGTPSKGIFIPNQHRLKPYPESSEIRVRIEPNQLEQARLKDICIIPACALFEAVRRVLDGEKPDRASIAARIAASKGVLEDIL